MMLNWLDEGLGQQRTAMYKHILVPTDGSNLSRKAIQIAAALARELGARITAIHVVPEGVPTVFSADRLDGSGLLGRQYRKLVESEAKRALAVVEIEAGIAGVAYAGVQGLAGRPWQAIIRTARSRRCDLIVMASHGRAGLMALALGSETTKVLARSKIPVLVCR
jgi:nucleotide-binding universal stress UspA family protein